MPGRVYTVVAVVAILVLAGGAGEALAASHTTVERTIQDCDGDNLLERAPGEEHVDPTQRDFAAPPGGCEDDPRREPVRLPATSSILNFLQLSDFQISTRSPRDGWSSSTAPSAVRSTRSRPPTGRRSR